MISNILIEVMASVSEQEHLTIRKRQREGIDVAMLAGKKFRRRQIENLDNFVEVYEQWKNAEYTAKVEMERLKLK